LEGIVRKLRLSEEKYRELVENANSIIVRRNASGTITFFNEFAQTFFGYTEDEILGRNVVGTIVPEKESTGRNLKWMIEDIANHPDLYVNNVNENVRRDGSVVWVAWTNKPVLDDSGKVSEVLCIGNDITEQRRAEEEREHLQERLHRAERMEAVGKLAGGVAHDLNNVLGVLVGYSELLLMEIPEMSPLRSHIRNIMASGERAAAIIQDLVTLARRGVAISEVIDLNALISGYAGSPDFGTLKARYPDVTFHFELAKDLLHLKGSPVHLEKTLMNLLSNAVEAITGAGEVTVQTDIRYLDRCIQGYDEVKEGDYVVLTVTDSGGGIFPRDMNRIFEPFYTNKVMGRSGTGLGLAVVWGTVKDHDGYIDVQSPEGKGSAFTLYFPVTREEPARTGADVSRESYRGRGESILVVDDVKEQRELAASMLQWLGYQVDTVSSGEEAIVYLEHGKVDLVILDMIMDPGMDGLETYERILKITARQKAIIVSGFSENERVRKSLELGVGDYVKKPYILERIGLAVRRELDRP
jgi:PAS domain S-box-containing protein